MNVVHVALGSVGDPPFASRRFSPLIIVFEPAATGAGREQGAAQIVRHGCLIGRDGFKQGRRVGWPNVRLKSRCQGLPGRLDGRHHRRKEGFQCFKIDHGLLVPLRSRGDNPDIQPPRKLALPKPTRPLEPALKPRKTPGQRRSAATVEAIVEAAARIQETKGTEGYTTNAVADRAGASIGTLYQYFPNKDAITRALIERELQALLADITAIVAEADGRAGLERLIEAAVRHQLDRPALARLLDREEGRLAIGADIQRIGESIAVVLRRCLEAAGLAGAAGEHTADDVLAIIKGMVDDAGRRGEIDAAALRIRVNRAVFGYLEAR